MNTYMAFFKNRKTEVKAETSYEAQKKAAAFFKAKKTYDVHVELLSIGDSEYVHTATN